MRQELRLFSPSKYEPIHRPVHQATTAPANRGPQARPLEPARGEPDSKLSSQSDINCQVHTGDISAQVSPRAIFKIRQPVLPVHFDYPGNCLRMIYRISYRH